MTSPKRNLKRNKNEEVILLHQLQYIDEAANIAFWTEQMDHYLKAGETLLCTMCGCCVNRSFEAAIVHREYLETHGAEVPELPT